MLKHLHIDFRIGGNFDVEMDDKQLEEFNAGYGVIRLQIRDKIRAFKDFLKDVDVYSLELKEVKEECCEESINSD